MSNIFDSLLTTASDGSTNITIGSFILCVVFAMLLGLVVSYIVQYKNHSTKSFLVTIALLPAVVSVVIMMVNGSIGAGIAVAGAFSLIRFRSVPGTAKEIGAIFIAMATGLACGMGYVGYGAIFVIIIGLFILILEKSNFASSATKESNKVIRITIPEDLDYNGVFEEIFEKYTEKFTLAKVRTTNLGSMFKLTYNVEFRNNANEKEFIDELRVRNGNLEISSSIFSTSVDSL